MMGLRSVAVGLVVIGHWTNCLFPIGEAGRLSNFGDYLENSVYWLGTGGWGQRLGVFYSRRFLRIIPPYYLALALGAALPLATLHQYPAWFLPLSNVLCYQMRHWPEG
ncbi:MAG: hypothetical protein WKG07_22335 [Hymenobacter sp.]